jgi:hypothetical protein
MFETWEWWNENHDEAVLVIWNVSGGDCYDWWEIAIVLNQRGEYALYSDSGCSCSNQYESGWDKYDLAWTNDLNEVKRRAREWVNKTEKISVGRKADNLSKLSKLNKK